MPVAANSAPPCLVLIDARGVATVEIADPEGEVYSYAAAAAPEGLDEWACTLRRTDTGATHRLAVNGRGRWRCSCLDNVYRNRRHRSRGRGAPCKHLEAVMNLKRFLDSLSPRKEKA